ncbi:MAG: tetratricopeptide repeat protein [Candidatus Acidiferrales bacterium]
MIGQTLGHYRIVEKIGAGGMGEVYRAHDEQLDRDVALKVLPAGTLADDAARKQFRKEALALAKLNHPNIETVFEFSSQNGVNFLAMELIAGSSLSERLKEGPLAGNEIQRLGIQLAEGLTAAHDQGIIHRDLKPGNLFLTPDGRLKILDFGLAKIIHPELGTDVTQSTAADSTTISGTVPYMSPEQLRGLPVDARSDIYAAGAVLYEMATGQRPFPQTQSAELIGAILHWTPPPPSTVNPHVSPGLESVICRALERELARRYQSARGLRAALEALSGGVPREGVGSQYAAPANAGASATVVLRPRTHLYVASVALVIVLAGGLVLGLNVRGLRDRLLRGNRSDSTSATKSSAPINARRSVAVLGFKNVSGRPDEAWLSTALSEMLTTELSAGEKLRTVPGENVAQMKVDLSLPEEDSYGKETLAKIHKNLNADEVVLGSYFPLGKGNIRLDLRLQDAVQGETLAAVSEKGSADQIDDLVSRAGASLREKLGAGAVSDADAAAVRATLPSNPEEARFYSEGLAKLRVFDALAARDRFERAVAAEPEYPLAHAGLASAWSTLGYDANSQAEAKKAFELSTNLPREQRLWIEGRYRESTHDWPKAVEVYKALRDFFPDNLDYGLRLIAAQTSASQGKDALATIEDLRKLPPPARDDPRIDLAEANAVMTLGNFKRALETADSARTKGDGQGARLLVARAQLTEGSALQNLGQTKEAIQANEQAKRLFSAAGDRGGVASALINLGGLFYGTGDVAGAKRAWEESLLISREIGDEAHIQTSLGNLATLLKHTGDLGGARLLFDQALEIAKKIGNTRGEAQITSNLAGLLYQQGDLQGAVHTEENALEAFRQIGDRNGVAKSLSNIRTILADRGDLTGAKNRYVEAIATFRQIGQKSGVASVTNQLANLLYMQSDLAEAKSLYEQALAACTEIGDKSGMLLAQGNLGNVLYDLGDLLGARQMYDQSLTLARQSDDKTALARNLANIGYVLEAQGDLAGARKAYEESLSTRKQIGEKGGVAATRLSLASHSIEEGNPAEAEQPAREAAEEFGKEHDPIDQAVALSALADSLFKQGRTAPARKTIDTALQIAGKNQANEFRAEIFIVAAHIRAASGETETARKSLESLLEEGTKLRNVATQFEVRLALGEVEMKSGKTAAGRARLAALEKDATAKGFLLIARDAAAAAR